MFLHLECFIGDKPIHAGVEWVTLYSVGILHQEVFCRDCFIPDSDVFDFIVKQVFDISGCQSDIALYGAHIYGAVAVIHNAPFYCILDFFIFTLFLLVLPDTCGYNRSKGFGVIYQCFESLCKVHDHGQVGTVAEKTAGFTVKMNLANVGIVLKGFLESGIPFISVSVCAESLPISFRLSDFFCVGIKGCLPVIRIFVFEKAESEAQAIVAVIVCYYSNCLYED